MVQVTPPKEGSRWRSSDGVRFRVLSTVCLDDGHWVHYIKESTTEEIKEYSCYVESFLSRFSETQD
jgi:hypothetical protein